MTSPNGRQVFRRPLVAFDGSSHAEAALAQATEMVQTSNGRLSVITVVPEPSLWALSGTYWAPMDFGVIDREVEPRAPTSSSWDRADAGGCTHCCSAA